MRLLISVGAVDAVKGFHAARTMHRAVEVRAELRDGALEASVSVADATPAGTDPLLHPRAKLDLKRCGASVLVEGIGRACRALLPGSGGEARGLVLPATSGARVAVRKRGVHALVEDRADERAVAAV